jgi:hypothetical protein
MHEEELIKYHDKQKIRFEFPEGAVGVQPRKGTGILSYYKPHDMWEILGDNFSILLEKEMIEQIDYDPQDKTLELYFIRKR